MFDLAWSEILLIGAVALIAIGPKELPNAIRTVSGLVKKAREMAWEFRGHLDEMVREAKLDEVRDQFNQIRNFDLKGEVEKTIDPGGDLRRTVEETGQSVQDIMKHDPLAPKTPFGPAPDGAAQAPGYDAQAAADAYDAAGYAEDGGVHSTGARHVTAEDMTQDVAADADVVDAEMPPKPGAPDFVPPQIAAVVLPPRPAFVPPDIPRG